MQKNTLSILLSLGLLLLLVACASASPGETPVPPAATRGPATETPLPSETPTAVPSATPEPTATELPTATDTPEPTATATTAPTATDTPEPTATLTNTPVPAIDHSKDILFYYVQLDNGGNIGCGDSLVAYRTGYALTGDVAADAAQALNVLWRAPQYSGALYNAAYVSNLQVLRVEYDPYTGDMSVFLTGSFVRPEDPCDKLRYNAQIRATALQFPGARTVRFWLENGKLLGDLLCVDC